MPEIGEVARIVHYLRKHLVGKTVSAVKVQEDDIVYGKVGTSASAFQKAMTGKKVVGAKQQGKYFWLEMSSPPHPLMHFGMSGWMKFSHDPTSFYYKPSKPESQEWPPKYWKFILETDSGDTAFVDARRLGRIRLIDVPAASMRQTTPLKENGPDPVIDKDILTSEWLTTKCRSKRVPIKALLLDQANISGVGNWVADEVLYNARIHPEQYSNTLSEAQQAQLHKSLIYVCTLACETLADSDKFPEDWLMKHRWSKGKKDQNKLPNGEKIVFLTVGGRTSAVVPSLQKKTGPVAGDIPETVKAELDVDDEEGKGGKSAKAAVKAASSPRRAKRKSEATNGKADEFGETEVKSPASKKSKASQKEVKSKITSEGMAKPTSRTSGRLRKT